MSAAPVNTPIIRETLDDELEQILAVYPLAFPDEELRPIVSELITGDAEILSLGAIASDEIIGHAVFTILSGNGARGENAGALLGPLCVHPKIHGKGIGSTLVKHGFEQLENSGVRQVFVLGDPDYYGRFGFGAERDVQPPYPLPDEWDGAWQSVLLGNTNPLIPGACTFPKAWMKPELWLP